ncbi:hypothetical protein DUZ99_03495 [Xylanibacillus composti]|nr:hypothetical protein [Xylanibacillus composti]
MRISLFKGKKGTGGSLWVRCIRSGVPVDTHAIQKKFFCLQKLITLVKMKSIKVATEMGQEKIM